MNLREIVQKAEVGKTALGHFNISDLIGFKAIWEAAKELNLPVVIGTSEGEREFIGAKQAVDLIKSIREEYGYPIFINADHTHSLEKVKEAVSAGYDSVIADFAKLPLAENIKATKEAVDYVRSVRPEMVIEGELGYIGSSSEIFKELPAGAAINPEDLTRPEDAARFVRETGVDMLAPAVGNIHGMFENASSPRLNIQRVAEIKAALQQVQGKPVPLVLHGGSGTLDEDFTAAIQAGISIVHINTEIRRAWKEGMLQGLKLDSVAPYKIAAPAVEAVKAIVKQRLALFSGQS